MVKHIDALRHLGYRVEPAMFMHTEEIPTSWHVAGPGVELYVAENDVEAWESLLRSHAGRSLYEELSDEDRAALRSHGDLDIHQLAALPASERARKLTDWRGRAAWEEQGAAGA